MQSIFRLLFETTAMPSLATWTSEYLTPPFSQAGTSSSSLIGRDALETSVSPAQNFSKPPPVPDAPTVNLTPGFSSLKSSVAASAKGKTVDEPSMAIVPVSPSSDEPEPPLPPSSPPHAATPSASAHATASAGIHRMFLIEPVLLGWVVRGGDARKAPDWSVLRIRRRLVKSV